MGLRLPSPTQRRFNDVERTICHSKPKGRSPSLSEPTGAGNHHAATGQMEVVKHALQRIRDERLHVSSGQPVGPSQQTVPPAGPAGQILQPKASRPAQRGISRRAVIVGLLAGLGIGGKILAWVSQGSDITQSPQTFPQSPPQAFPDPHLLYTYGGHSDSVNAVAWSPDGTRIASGSVDKTVQVWNAP
jgi:WD40 repeat protein